MTSKSPSAVEEDLLQESSTMLEKTESFLRNAYLTMEMTKTWIAMTLSSPAINS